MQSSVSELQNAMCGELMIVPSSLTGKPLAYFTPLPASELAACVPACSEPQPRRSRAAAWLLLRPYVTMEGGTDESTLTRLCVGAISGTLSTDGRHSLVGIARMLHAPNLDLRKQISFAGGKTPSTATCIYAPPSELPRLVDDLGEHLSSGSPANDPLHAAVLVMQAAVRAHPFADANGRWSRLLGIVAAQRAGDPWAGLTVGLFTKKKWSRAWVDPQTFSRDGLTAFAKSAREFSDHLHEACANAGLVAAMESIAALVDATIPQPARRVKLMADLASGAFISLASLRALLDCSARKVSNFMDRIAISAQPWSEYEGCGVSLKRLGDAAAACVEQAIPASAQYPSQGYIANGVAS